MYCYYIFIINYKHKTLPAYFQNWQITQNKNIHNHFTLAHNIIHTFRAQYKFAKKSPRYSLPHTINNTSDILNQTITTHSLKGLIHYVKQHIIQGYKHTCRVVNCYICKIIMNTQILATHSAINVFLPHILNLQYPCSRKR